MQQNKKFWKSVLILSLTSILLRSLSVRFTGYLNQRIGAEGLGLFTLTLSVYGLSITLATSSVGFASTRLIAEAIGQNKPEKILPSMKSCALYSLFFGCLSGFLLFLFSKPIGIYLLHDSRTILFLRLLSLTLPFVSLTSALSGYFTAVRRVSRASAVQIGSQLVKMATVILLLERILPNTPFGSGLSLILGSVISELFSFLFTWIFYRLDSKRYVSKKKSTTDISQNLLSIALPMAFSSYLRSALNTIEHLLIPWGLCKQGKNRSQALEIYGVVQGMALPIILFPYAFLSPYCSLIVPEISELRAREGDKKEKIREKTENIIHFVCLFGIGTAGLVVCYSQELGQILYAGTQAASYIHLLAPIIPIMYVDTAVDSILKGMNEQVYSMKINLLDSLLSVALVFLLMPQIGIYGYLVEIYVCEILNASLSISRLLTVVQPNMALFSSVFLPLFSIIGSTALTRLLFLACSLPLILDGYQLFLQMTVCGLLYLFFCHILQNAFSKAKKNGILYRSFIKTNCQPWKRQNLKNQEPEVKKSKN